MTLALVASARIAGTSQGTPAQLASCLAWRAMLIAEGGSCLYMRGEEIIISSPKPGPRPEKRYSFLLYEYL